ncbi:MAG: hypothetical protein OXU68_01405 [Bacteroidota bacterium]|nr:hypothetical protein [Bacteroidota bacterium]
MSSGTGRPVTDAMRRGRDGVVADILGDASRWHSHGRGITMGELTGSDVRLKIHDYGADPDLNSLIHNYHGLAADCFARLGLRAYIH